MSTIPLLTNQNIFISADQTVAQRSLLMSMFFGLCLLFIGGVSAWDAWLVEANTEILNSEQNPICRYLIEMDPNSKVYFFIGKGISSMGVLAILIGLRCRGYRHTIAVTLVVVAFQLGLLIYLYFSDQQLGGLPNLALMFQDTREDVFTFRYW